MQPFITLLGLAWLAGGLIAARSTGPAGGDRKPADTSHEIIFKVAKLECCLVNGVGCGHLLAPTLEKLDSIEGVARSYSNWTGTLLRVSVTQSADRDAVAERVRTLLAADQQEPVRIEDKELAEALSKEEWRGVDRIADLTSYEFKTVAKRRATAFADEQKLDQSTRDKLLALVDELWDKVAEGLGPPKPDETAYAAYWRERCDKVARMYLDKARGILSADQIATMAREYADRPKRGAP